MNQDDFKKLRAHYHVLIEIRGAFEDRVKLTTNVIEDGAVDVMIEEFKKLQSKFPDFVSTIDFKNYHTFSHGYQAPVILTHLGAVIGRLKVAIDTSEATPLIKPLDFPFVKDAHLRKIAERDFIEVQKASSSQCWKSVILLSGGIIEAVLTDLLEDDSSRSTAAKRAPKDKASIRDWGFVELILVAEELGLINPGVEKLSHSVRQYRNLVHPSVEIRDKLTVAPEEAKIAIEVLIMLHRDLSISLP